MIQYYYQDELRYLYQAGKEFARTHPDIARYLHIDSESKDDRDPYVERLFEGFAFLTGRIRERLDDELPELTESLCTYALAPLPEAGSFRFYHRVQAPAWPCSANHALSRRARRYASVPAGDDATVCRFRTTHEVRAPPAETDRCQPGMAVDGASSVTSGSPSRKEQNSTSSSSTLCASIFMRKILSPQYARVLLAVHQKVALSAAGATVELDGKRPFAARRI